MNKLLTKIKSHVISLTQHFHYDEDIINILTLCYFAIVSFDEDVKDILEMVLCSKYILVNDGSYDEMLKKYYPDINSETDNYKEPSFDNNERYNDDFIIICDWRPHSHKRKANYYIRDVLDSFLHEIKHAMNSIIKSFDKNGNRAVFHCGIYTMTSRIPGDLGKFLLLDESFNCFLIKLYLEQIERIKNCDIKDQGLNHLLQNFSLYAYAYSYDKTTRLLEPIFSNEEMFKLFYNATLFKDFKPLFDRLEEIYQDDSYYVFDESLFDYFFSCKPTLPRMIDKFPPKGPKLSLDFNENNLRFNID